MNDPAMLLCIIQYSSKTVRDNENRESDVNKAKMKSLQPNPLIEVGNKLW